MDSSLTSDSPFWFWKLCLELRFSDGVCAVTLPAVPPPDATDRSMPAGEVSAAGCPLHEWQQELVLLAYVLSGQTGPDAPKTCAEVAQRMNTEEACDFVEKAVSTFLQRGQASASQ